MLAPAPGHTRRHDKKPVQTICTALRRYAIAVPSERTLEPGSAPQQPRRKSSRKPLTFHPQMHGLANAVRLLCPTPSNGAHRYGREGLEWDSSDPATGGHLESDPPRSTLAGLLAKPWADYRFPRFRFPDLLLP
jgi:hypothetical protein